MIQELSEVKNVQKKVIESYPCLFSVSADDIEVRKFIRKCNKQRRFSKPNKNAEKV